MVRVTLDGPDGLLAESRYCRAILPDDPDMVFLFTRDPCHAFAFPVCRTAPTGFICQAKYRGLT